MRKSVLIIDDETSLLKALERYFVEEGYHVATASDGQAGLDLLKKRPYDVLLIDLMLPHFSGIDVVRQSRKIRANQTSVVMTGFGTIASAIEAIRAGAYHYVTKPFDLEDIGSLVSKAIEHMRLRQENNILRRQLKKKYSFENMIGQSEVFQEVLNLAERIAETDSTILITGESGTGKEVLAKAIHYRSDRADRPFVAVNCAAIPEGLLESELFGHMKGAFTDAIATRPGRFEAADHGTLFLDEIGDMSPQLQVKVLRVLQERRFEPVGSAQPREVDIRIIAATNQELQKAIKEGRFREDLYYRLNVIPVHLPPLRERKGDIPLLAEYFLKRFNRDNDKAIEGFTKEAMAVLKQYRWPGNVRELENAIERSVVLKQEGLIRVEELPQPLGGTIPTDFVGDVLLPEEGVDLRQVLQEVEKNLIQKALDRTKGNKNQAANLLGLNRTTLIEKMRKVNGHHKCSLRR